MKSMKRFCLLSVIALAFTLFPAQGSYAFFGQGNDGTPVTIHIQLDGFVDDAVITFDGATGLAWGNRPYYGDYLRGVVGFVFSNTVPSVSYVTDTHTIYIIRADRTWSNYFDNPGNPPSHGYDGTWSFYRAEGAMVEGPTTEK